MSRSGRAADMPTGKAVAHEDLRSWLTLFFGLTYG